MYFSRILEYSILVNFISVGIRFKLDTFQLKKVKTCLFIKKNETKKLPYARIADKDLQTTNIYSNVMEWWILVTYCPLRYGGSS